MSKILTIDIGAGTMDILYYDTESGLHYKSVVKSPVASIAAEIEQTEGKLVVVGCEMGGGAVSGILKERAGEAGVVMSESAAATIHHSLERVHSLGIHIVPDSEAEEMSRDSDYTRVVVGDIEPDRIQRIVEGFGIPFNFDIVGICAQDHGVAPAGVSHLDYRHNNFKALLDKNPYPHTLLYKDSEVPENMNRLRSITGSAAMLPAGEIYVMDSGMAAILGASMDPRVQQKSNVLVMDIATSHTVGAALQDGELAGFFEYHTHDITRERLEELLHGLADGKLEHKQILSEGGHGAYVRKAFGFDNAGAIVATGPKRKLIAKTRLPILPGAPLGDNMMTGTVGLLEAIRRRKGMQAIAY